MQDAIDALRWRPRLSVLDVGGSPGTLKAFLPEDWVVVADVADQGGLDLYATGLALPFADGAFDVVAACDTPEHVPPADPPPFLAQLARVAGEAVLIAAPFDDPQVNAAEDVLQELIRTRYGEGYHFLEEH